MAYEEQFQLLLQALPQPLKEKYSFPVQKISLKHEILKLLSALTLWERGLRDIEFEKGSHIEGRRYGRVVDIFARYKDETIVTECECHLSISEVLYRRDELNKLFRDFCFILALPQRRLRKDTFGKVIDKVNEVWLIDLERLEVTCISNFDDLKKARNRGMKLEIVGSCRSIKSDNGCLHLPIPLGAQEKLAIKEDDKFLVRMDHDKVIYQRKEAEVDEADCGD